MLLFLASFFALALLSSSAAAEGGEKEEVAGRAEDPCDAWIHRYFNKKNYFQYNLWETAFFPA